MKKHKCSNCQTDMKSNPNKYSLMAYKIENDKIIHSANDIFPVKTFLCGNCGKVDLYHAEFDLIRD